MLIVLNTRNMNTSRKSHYINNKVVFKKSHTLPNISPFPLWATRCIVSGLPSLYFFLLIHISIIFLLPILSYIKLPYYIYYFVSCLFTLTVLRENMNHSLSIHRHPPIFFSAACSSIANIYHTLFIHSPMDEHVGF